MSQSQLQAGDVVKLKSGGPEMTVAWVDESDAQCHWFEGTEMKTATVTVATLEKHQPPNPKASLSEIGGRLA